MFKSNVENMLAFDKNWNYLKCRLIDASIIQKKCTTTPKRTFYPKYLGIILRDNLNNWHKTFLGLICLPPLLASPSNACGHEISFVLVTISECTGTLEMFSAWWKKIKFVVTHLLFFVLTLNKNSPQWMNALMAY